MPSSVEDRPLFSIEAVVFHWRDVVCLGEASAALADLRRDVREGVTALECAERDGPPLDSSAVRAAADEFRFERHLLAAEELEAWLARWELSTADWFGHIRRGVARSRMLGLPSNGVEVEDVLWVDLVCSGTLASLAQTLAERAAAAAALGRRVDLDPGALEQAFLDFGNQIDVLKERERLLAAYAQAWLRIECALLRVDDEEVAREVVLLADEKRCSLAQLAAQIESDFREGWFWLGDLDPAVSDQLLSALPGEVVGPLLSDAGYVVAEVRAKRPPALGDPEVDRRLGEELRARSVATQVNNVVRWHDRP